VATPDRNYLLFYFELDNREKGKITKRLLYFVEKYN
jgi:hypothetical protein